MDDKLHLTVLGTSFSVSLLLKQKFHCVSKNAIQQSDLHLFMKLVHHVLIKPFKLQWNQCTLHTEGAAEGEAADAEALVDKAGRQYGCNYGFLRYMLHGHDVSLWMATATFCAPVFLFVFILLLVSGSRAFTQYLAAQICRRAILWLDTTSEERVQPETSWSNTVVFCFHQGVTLFLDVSNLCMFTCGHDASH